jgi:ABC-type oligopeptide transport system ATPase subunit
VISHDLAVLRRVANRIGVMHQGVLVGLGTIDEVFDNPWHPYVAGLASALAPGSGTDRAGVGEDDVDDADVPDVGVAEDADVEMERDGHAG